MVSIPYLTGFLDNSLGRLIIAVSIVVVTIIFQRIVSLLIRRSFERSSKVIKVDPTHFSLLRHTTSAIIMIFGLGIAINFIPSLKALSVSLFAGAGVMAVVVGFASQKAFSNVVSGIFIAIFKPFRVGDTIKFGDKTGTVEDITLRHTVIRNFENKRFIVPNSTISEETIENYNIEDPKICRHVEFGISYDSDIDKAISIMRDEAMKHPNFIDNRTKKEIEDKIPAVIVRVIGFGDSSVNIRAWVWAKDAPSAFEMGCDLNKSIKERFDKEEVEIPFPYRTIVHKK